MKLKPASGVKLGSLRVDLDETRLSAVQAAAGGEILSEGDASESSASLCYTLPAMRLWLWGSRASGDIWGVMAVSIRPGNTGDKRCPSLPRTLQPVVFDHGVALGMSQEQLTARLGAPSRIRGNAHEYQFREDIKSRDGYNCTLSNALEVRIRNGIVDAVRATLNTGC